MARLLPVIRLDRRRAYRAGRRMLQAGFPLWHVAQRLGVKREHLQKERPDALWTGAVGALMRQEMKRAGGAT